MIFFICDQLYEITFAKYWKMLLDSFVFCLILFDYYLVSITCYLLIVIWSLPLLVKIWFLLLLVLKTSLPELCQIKLRQQKRMQSECIIIKKKSFFLPSLFSTKNFSRPKFFFDQTILWPIFFLPKAFFYPNFFWPTNFFTNFFLTNIIFITFYWPTFFSNVFFFH